MRQNKEKILAETETAFAFAVLLLNFLILAAVISLVWLLQSLISLNSPLSAALGQTIWR